MSSSAKAGADDGGWTWGSILCCLCCALPVVCLILHGLSLAADSTRAAAQVAQFQRENTSMVCVDGVIVYRDDSALHKLAGNLFARGHFQCTDWRMREFGPSA
jgi:hypothetical protein